MSSASGIRPQPPERMILIGMRGAGKTAVGRALSTRLGWILTDTDEQITDSAGRSIREIFESDGEAAFRDLEERAIALALESRHCVVSVGGGAVLREANRRRIASGGVCVWLRASAAELDRRLRADAQTPRQRPVLSRLNDLDEIHLLLAQRDPLYRACAAFSLDTDGRSVDEVSEEILARTGLSAAPPPFRSIE